MGFLTTRLQAMSLYLWDRFRFGIPEYDGPLAEDVLFVLDGVGGFQFVPLFVRRALRDVGASMGTVAFRWQFGLVGEIWTDLMWLRRNRVMGARLARKILSVHRRHPAARIHLFACSGGAGIAAFACESLRGRQVVDTAILACPALSPGYNLAPALRAVRRCYALVSHCDRWILGAGTRLFGTMDRCFGASGGLRGFRIPPELAPADSALYDRLREIRWTPALRRDGHHGGHTGWPMPRFLRRHLLPLIQGTPLLPTHALAAPSVEDFGDRRKVETSRTHTCGVSKSES